MALPRKLLLHKNPYLWLQHKFHEYPSYAWSLTIFFTTPVWFIAQDQLKRHYWEFHQPAPLPVTYETPDRPRRPVPSKYDD